MGIPGEYDHPDYKRALERVVKAGKKHGKRPRPAGDRRRRRRSPRSRRAGTCICYHGDAWLLQVAIRQGIDGIRAGVGEGQAGRKGQGRR